jgi:uncharacterized protein YjbI with pentapeptide repeats
MAMGYYDIQEAPGGPSNEWILAESWNGSTWSVLPSPGFSSAPIPYASGTSINDISCTSSTNCIGVGNTEGCRFDACGGPTVIKWWDGITWADVPSPNQNSLNSLVSVSCSTPGDCVAVGQSSSGITPETSSKTLIETGISPPATTPNCSYIGPEAALQGCNLTDFNLAGVNLSVSNLSNTDLTGANLSDANLMGSDLTDANLSDANLTGVISGGIIGTPSALPPGWVLTKGYLAGPGSNLSYDNLTGADLAGANLTDAYLVGSTLTDANLSSTDLTGANLTGVWSGGITGTPSSLPSEWSLTNGYLIGPGALLYDADLASANLTGADLAYATLDFANLTDANLTGANLTGTYLAGVTWYDTTCPDGTNSNNDGNTCANNLG